MIKKAIKLSLLLGLSTSLFAISSLDKKVLDYQENAIKQNNAYILHTLKLEKKEPLDDKNLWNAYKLQLDLTQKDNNKRFQTPMIVFSNGKYISNEMIDMSTGQRYGEAEQQSKSRQKRKEFETSFTLPDNYYKQDHLIAGNHDAKNKVVLFSDPLCVYCIKSVPAIINKIKSRKDIALYYYDFPLNMHPTAQTVVLAMMQAKKDGVKNVELEVYEANYENFYNVYREKNPNKAIEAFNEIFDTTYKLQDVNTNANKKQLEHDIKMALGANVQATPSVLFNGSYLNSRKKLDIFLSK